MYSYAVQSSASNSKQTAGSIGPFVLGPVVSRTATDARYEYGFDVVRSECLIMLSSGDPLAAAALSSEGKRV